MQWSFDLATTRCACCTTLIGSSFLFDTSLFDYRSSLADFIGATLSQAGFQLHARSYTSYPCSIVPSEHTSNNHIQTTSAERRTRLCLMIHPIHIPLLLVLKVLSAYDHTSSNAPDTIRTQKLNGLGLYQYFGGGPQGNLQCCMQSIFLFVWHHLSIDRPHPSLLAFDLFHPAPHDC